MSIQGISRENVSILKTEALNKAKRFEFYAAPYILYTKGIQGFSFEFQENTLVNKIYALAVSTFAMIFTLGLKVKWGLSGLNQAKTRLFEISMFEAQDAVKKEVFANPKAEIDWTKPLDAKVCQQFFVVFCQRFQSSNVATLIQKYPEKLSDPTTAIMQMFTQTQPSLADQTKRRLIVDRILEKLPDETNPEKLKRLISVIANWGGDTYIDVIHTLIDKTDKSFITQEFLNQWIADIVNNNSQEEKPSRLPRNHMIDFILGLDEMYALDVHLSNEGIQGALGDSVRDQDEKVTSALIKKAKQLKLEIDFTVARAIVGYISDESIKKRFLDLLK